MKTKLIFFLLSVLIFSCTTINKPVPDAYKDKAKGEIKEVLNNMFRGNEEVNYDMVIEPFQESPDFRFLIHGYALNYKQLVDGIKPIYNTLLNQKVTIVDEEYAFIDKKQSYIQQIANCWKTSKTVIHLLMTHLLFYTYLSKQVGSGK